MSATAAEIDAALVRLRVASSGLRARSRDDVLASLGAVLERLRDPSSSARRALEAELPAATGFTPEVVGAGLALALDGWTAGALRALVAAELGSSATAVADGFGVTAVLLGGALPMPTLLALLAPLVLGSPVLAKTAQHDPVTARIFARTLTERDPDLGACLEIVSFPGHDADCTQRLLAADCVVATGSDETIASLSARVRPPRRFVGYGHRVSVAVIGPGALAGDALLLAARGLALDVSLWDQLGCLSPVSAFVVGRAEPVAEALSRELATLATQLPRGRVGMEAAAALANARDEAELRAAAGAAVTLHGRASDGWSVVCEADARLRAAPLHRFLRVHPVSDTDGLLAALTPIGPHLAGVSVTGFGEGTHALARSLAALGASRVCAPGRLQAPPLAWRHDGQGVLLPMARLADVELG